MGKPLSTKSLAALIVAPFLLCLACAIAFRLICTFESRTSAYGPLTISGSRGNYTHMHSMEPANCKLFVALPDDGLFPIAAIPPDVLDRRFRRHDVDGDSPYTSYAARGEGWYLNLQYKSGQLRYFEGRPYSFQKTVEGAPLAFPISYKELHAVWGTPDRIESKRKTVPISSP